MHTYLFILLLIVACHAPQPRDGEAQTVNGLETDSIPLTKKDLLGQLDPARDAGFTLIDSSYTDKRGIYLRKPTYEAFVRMARAAREAGITLRIVSATRNFAAQKSIWEAKWNGQRKVDDEDLSHTIPNAKERALKILEYSSMPGTSRHHWGTDMDLNALSNEYFDSDEGKEIYDWLLEHATEYGFCQVYTEQNEDRPDGYHEERWHWSYLPLAYSFLQQYNEQVSYDDLGGFAGGEVAEEVGAIAKYVNGIAPGCKDWGEE